MVEDYIKDYLERRIIVTGNKEDLYYRVIYIMI